MHGLDGAHPLLLAVFLGNFPVDAERKEARLLQVLPPEGDASVKFSEREHKEAE